MRSQRLRLGIERQEVARCSSGCPLLDRELQAGFGFGVRLYRLDHAHHGAGVEQVSRRGESRHGVVGPCLAREATVFDLRIGMQRLVPKRSGLRDVLVLQFFELIGCEAQLRHRWLCVQA